VFDANGVATLADSFKALDRCGRLVVYGFHTNLPRGGSHLLSPWEWGKMAVGMFRMPAFDPMQMTLESKAVLGFNLSFFADEVAVIKAYLAQVDEWVVSKELKLPNTVVFEMDKIGEAHRLIQSGQSVGKIVVRTRATPGLAVDRGDGPEGAKGVKRE